MKWKTLFIGLIGIVLACTMSAPPVSAGSPQKHRWEGVAIGVGAALLGGALYHNAHRPWRHSRPAYSHPGPPRGRGCGPRYCPPRRPRPCGHWEWRKTWVPPVCEKTWNPGHYNRRRRWIPGRWIRVETQPGYWQKEKVWVPN